MSGDSLFNNPMVEAAKKALTPEQLADYKLMGEYMYNNVDYKQAEMGPHIKPATQKETAFYATQALNSGLSPMNLSSAEIQALIEIHGEQWYKLFNFQEDEVPKPPVHVIEAPKLNRRERRMIERTRARKLKHARKEKKD